MSVRLSLAPEPPVEDGPAAPPWPHVPTVEWQVCGVCNYHCSYCIQSREHRQGHPTDEHLDRMLAFLGSLPGTWEIKTTGGEPFAFRGFMKRIVPALMRTRHRVSTLTNLSAPLPVLGRFAELTHGRLSVLSASLHLEFTAPETFITKLTSLRPLLADDARVVVNCVLVPDRLDEVRAARDCARGRLCVLPAAHEGQGRCARVHARPGGPRP
ncbi:MAG: hypothetical protein HY904_12010 [Deltaproteobacteria bacterium]|nr:hypothetical protein [Deltaproteobacteria bacterium]